MMLSLLEMNPGLLAQMGMAARGIMPELARLEKLKELKVRGESQAGCLLKASLPHSL